MKVVADTRIVDTMISLIPMSVPVCFGDNRTPEFKLFLSFTIC
jgi:hypothetical protein